MLTGYCKCEECKSNKYRQEDFFVDTDKAKPILKKGLTGVLRVKNEVETLYTCIESCVKYLDELIIVLQPSVDGSEEIVNRCCRKYPNKIKLFKYLPTVRPYIFYDRNILSEVEKLEIINNFNDVHSSANYINYAFSKASYKYVIKIDADQWYTDKLLFIKYAYTGNHFRFLTILKYIYKPKIIVGLLKIYRIIKKYKSKSNFVLTVSGVNLFRNQKINKGRFFCLKEAIDTKVPKPVQEKETDTAIISLFNGCGDHVVYKNTTDNFYNINTKYLYEQLVFKKKVLPKVSGILFFHLQYAKSNSVKNNKLLNIDLLTLFKNNQDKIVPLQKFLKYKFKDIENNYTNKKLIENYLTMFKSINIWNTDMFFLNKSTKNFNTFK